MDRSIATDSAIIDRANRRQAKMEKKAADSIIKFQDNANKTNPNPAHAKQHQAKANKYFIKAIEYAEQGQKIVERKENSQRLYNSITSGEKKAGKDFIVQRDYNFYPMLLPVPDVGLLVGGAFNREMRIIER